MWICGLSMLNYNGASFKLSVSLVSTENEGMVSLINMNGGAQSDFFKSLQYQVIWPYKLPQMKEPIKTIKQLCDKEEVIMRRRTRNRCKG